MQSSTLQSSLASVANDSGLKLDACIPCFQRYFVPDDVAHSLVSSVIAALFILTRFQTDKVPLKVGATLQLLAEVAVNSLGNLSVESHAFETSHFFAWHESSSESQSGNQGRLDRTLGVGLPLIVRASLSLASAMREVDRMALASAFLSLETRGVQSFFDMAQCLRSLLFVKSTNGMLDDKRKLLCDSRSHGFSLFYATGLTSSAVLGLASQLASYLDRDAFSVTADPLCVSTEEKFLLWCLNHPFFDSRPHLHPPIADDQLLRRCLQLVLLHTCNSGMAVCAQCTANVTRVELAAAWVSRWPTALCALPEALAAWLQRADRSQDVNRETSIGNKKRKVCSFFWDRPEHVVAFLDLDD